MGADVPDGLHSMTGFGRGAADAGERRLHVEIRSLNHRGLDLKIRSRDPDAYCDHEIGRAVRAALERGAVSVQLRDESHAGSTSVDEARVRDVHAALDRLRQELEIDEPVGLGTVASFMNTGSSDGLAGERLWEALRPAVDAALAELRTSRAREGGVLAADLSSHHARLGALAKEIAARASTLPGAFARRLNDRLQALAGQPGVDPARLAQEVALMAERLDVAEENVRLGAHLQHFIELLRGGGAVGRKLDFVIQEIGRELNTIASKAQDAGVSGLVIEAKATLEKLREQAQNVE